MLPDVAQPGAVVLGHAAYEAAGLAVRAAVLGQPRQRLDQAVGEVAELAGRVVFEGAELDPVADDGEAGVLVGAAVHVRLEDFHREGEGAISRYDADGKRARRLAAPAIVESHQPTAAVRTTRRRRPSLTLAVYPHRLRCASRSSPSSSCPPPRRRHRWPPLLPVARSRRASACPTTSPLRLLPTPTERGETCGPASSSAWSRLPRDSREGSAACSR